MNRHEHGYFVRLAYGHSELYTNLLRNDITILIDVKANRLIFEKSFRENYKNKFISIQTVSEFGGWILKTNKNKF